MKIADQPEPEDTVQVLMPERMARLFEERCLGRHTVGNTKLSPPILFGEDGGEDDIPTYIIEVGP